MPIKNKERVKRFAHLLAGFIILLHAYEKYESGHGPYLFFFFSGLVFLTIAIFHHKLEKKFPGVDAVFFIIEGILSMIVAYDYFHMGKKALPFMYLFAGTIQVIVAFVKYKKGTTNNAH